MPDLTNAVELQIAEMERAIARLKLLLCRSPSSHHDQTTEAAAACRVVIISHEEPPP